MTLIWALILLGVLILVHELGHFTAAKLTGVKVIRFSIGMGPKLFSFHIGETEYQVAILPLGGYVKLLAQEASEEIPEEDADRAFVNKPLWVRFLVVFAGPAASLLFPLFIYFPMYMGISEMTGTQLGTVFEGSPAYEAGLRSGDVITSVDGEETRYWEDMADDVKVAYDREIPIAVDRNGKAMQFDVTPERYVSKDKLGAEVVVGQIGIAADAVPPVVGPQGRLSPAFKSGIRLGDRVAEAGGSQIKYYWQLNSFLKRASNSSSAFELKIVRPAKIDAEGQEQAKEESFTALIQPELQEDGSYWHGLLSADTIIGKIDEGSPAELAGLLVGDRMLKVAGKPITSWTVIEKELRQSLDNPIEFVIERDREQVTLTIAQKKEEVQGEFHQPVTHYRFGAWSEVPYTDWIRADSVKVENRPWFAMARSAKTLYEITYEELRVIGYLFSGELSFKMVGGPILIFDIAGKAAERGAATFLWMMALISINLGIINLFPIPVLDGGHLMFFAIEAVMRKPVNSKIKEKATVVGLILLLLMMVMVFKNDVERYWDSIVAWFV